MKYNQAHYQQVFEEWPDKQELVEASENEPSLSECVQSWLERTPGLEENGFNFPAKFKAVVENIFEDELEAIEVLTLFYTHMSILCDSLFSNINIGRFLGNICLQNFIHSGVFGSSQLITPRLEKVPFNLG